jgi:nitrite reductase (cytochrome c-552)
MLDTHIRGMIMNTKWKIGFIVSSSILIGILSGYLLVSISEKKNEAKNPFFKVVEIGPMEDDPAIWGKNFPLQYDTYLRTVDQERTTHGGSEALPRTPDEADPRTTVAQSRLSEDPRLKIIWAGYPFSIDFREERGHAYMLDDQIHTKRQMAAPQPGACLNCHASTYTTMLKLGGGDLVKGFHAMNKLPYHEALRSVKHPVSCIDCHHPDTMELRITRPAFVEGIKALKKSQGIKDYVVEKMATRQEMRSFVCAQCHVEYFFKGAEKTLTYPWGKGIKADEIFSYYQENGHKDWVHAETGAQVLKAQHPEFEMWSQGTHAKAGVSCVDCHMPYQRVGAMKITNHHVRSPLLNINKSCQTCHHVPEADLLERVETIQARHLEMRNTAMNALVGLIKDLKAARGRKMSAEIIQKAQAAQREAQFLIDYIEAENSSGFHAPQEAARLMVKAMDKIREGQLILK